MASVDDVARDFTAMLRLGRFEAAGDRFWADDVVSIEPADLPGGIAVCATGVAAAREKRRAWFGANRIDDLSIDGPFVTGEHFALFMDMVVVDRASGAGRPFTEIAVFIVRDGRIRAERFFYG